MGRFPSGEEEGLVVGLRKGERGGARETWPLKRAGQLRRTPPPWGGARAGRLQELRREGGRSWLAGRRAGPQHLRGPALGAAPGGRTSTPGGLGGEAGPGRGVGRGTRGDANPQPPPGGRGGKSRAGGGVSGRRG